MLIANFYYILDGGLTVSFKNTSSGGPSSFSWEFGDGSTAVTDENPTHDYSTLMPHGGWVTVKLTISKVGEDPVSKEILLGVSPYTAALPTPINTFVKSILDEALVDDAVFSTLLTKWQIYLNNFAKVDTTMLHNELAWPALYNQLIAYLIVLDILVQEQMRYAGTLSSGGSIEGSSTGSGGSSSSGGLKSVKTGPSEAEWYDASEAWHNLFSTWSGGSQGESVSMGFYQNILNQICIIVRYLRVPFSLCPNQKKTNIVIPSVGYMPYEHIALDNYLLTNANTSQPDSVG